MSTGGRESFLEWLDELAFWALAIGWGIVAGFVLLWLLIPVLAPLLARASY